MGRKDKEFPETEAMLVTGRKGIPRYYKRFKKNGSRKHGSFSMRPDQRINGNAFSDYPSTQYAGKGEPRSD